MPQLQVEVDHLIGIKDISDITGIPERTVSYKLKNAGIKPDKVVDKRHYYQRDKVVLLFSQAKGSLTAKIICFANQKGGIGKTTSALNLGLALSSKGHKTAIIDFDPQANLSGQFCKPDTLSGTIGNLLDLNEFGFNSFSEDRVKQTHSETLTIFPSNIKLAGFLVPKGPGDYDRLDEFCKKHLDEFSYILIDCPPTLDIKLINALIASDICVVPSTPSHFSIQGMEDLAKTIKESLRRNKRLRVFSLINKFKPKLHLATLASQVAEFFPVLETKIPDLTVIEKVQALPGKNLMELDKNVFKIYMTLADEIENLFGGNK